MRRIPVAIITLVGSLVVAACSGRDTTAPRGIAPDQASATILGSPTCDFSAIKTAARNYFTSNQDSAFNYDQALQKAYNGGADANATNVGWQIGRLVAKERLTSATTNATAGATYLIDVLRCMSDVTAPKTNGLYPPLSLSANPNFLPNVVSILQSGIWEVRGGASPNEFPAAGRVIDNTTHVRSFGLPRWGAEAVGGTWPGDTQYAVYGYPTNIGTLVIGAASNINTNEVPANAFELGTLPDGTPKSDIRVGVCISVDPISGTANRIIHANSQVLDYSTMTDLCDYSNTNFVASATAPMSWYASFLRHAGSFLAPKPAYAQLTDCSDCIGGLPSGWSPFSTGAITASSVVLTFTTQPGNTVVSTTANDAAVVHATINGVPLVGVVIDSIAVENNSGSPAGAIITDFVPGTTDASGNATISFSVGKAGGYLITVLGHLDTFPTSSTTSTMFNVKNP